MDQTTENIGNAESNVNVELPEHEQEHTEMEESHGLNEADYIVLFFIIMIFIGLICREISKKIGFPYTPLLIIIGGIFGATNVWGEITNTTDTIIKIEPHAILIIFLPLLIFESSFNSHIEVLTKNFWQVMIIVGPGVLMTAFMMAVAIYYTLGYADEDFRFIEALILGVILSTTDPVAVVALLKELGAPLHIETLIEMESLFNDGIAMVFYAMFIDMAKGKEASVGQIFSQFFQLAIGGPAVGFMFGIATLLIMKLITKGMTTFISLIVAVSYTSFFVSEKFNLGVSGILAMVFAGITLNQNMKDYMTTKQKLGVSTILSYLQYVSETALFFLTGIFVGSILFTTKLSPDGTDNEIYADDWWRLIVMYIFLVLSRFIMMGICWPFLSILGEGFSYKEYIVACWGGIRGALSLALALIIYSDKTDKINQRTKDLILFHTTGISALTLLINGPTSGKVLSMVNLITNNSHRLYFKRNYLQKLKEEGNAQLKSMKNSDYFDMVEWTNVDKIIDLKGFDKDSEKMQGLEKKGYFKTINLNKISTINQNALNINFEDLKLQKIRYDIIRNFMAFVSKTKQQQWISSRIFNLIIDAAEESSEGLEKSIDMWHSVSYNMMSLKWLNYLRSLRRLPFIGSLISVWYHEEVAFTHEILYIFCICLTKTMTHERNFIEDMHVRNQMHHQVPKILEELKENWNKGNNYLSQLKQTHFEVVGKLEQRKAAMKVIMCQAKMIDEHISTFYLPEKEGNDIKEHLSKKLSTLQSYFGYCRLTTMGQSVLQNAFKDVLDQSELQEIISNSVEQRFLEGTVIMKRYEICEYIYVCSYGQIEEIIIPIDKLDKELPDYEVRIISGIGAITGLSNLLNDQDESLFEIKALTDVVVYKIPIADLRYKLYDNDNFEEFCYKKTLYHLLSLHQRTNKQSNTLTRDEVNMLADEGVLEHLQPFSSQEYTISFPYGGFIYEGSLKSIDDQGIELNIWDLIPESSLQYCAMEQSIVLIFQEPKKAKHDNQHRKRAADVFFKVPSDIKRVRQNRQTPNNQSVDQSVNMQRKDSILVQTMSKTKKVQSSQKIPQVQKSKKIHNNNLNQLYQLSKINEFNSGPLNSHDRFDIVEENIMVQPMKSFGDNTDVQAGRKPSIQLNSSYMNTSVQKQEPQDSEVMSQSQYTNN